MYFYPSFIGSLCVTIHTALEEETQFRVMHLRHFLIGWRG